MTSKVGTLPILTYHTLGHAPGPLATDPSWFAESLDALVASGHRAVDLDAWVADGRPAVARGFALTFDDGLRSIRAVADVVARHRVPATVFLVTDRVGRDNDWPGQPSWVPREPLLDWSEIADLAAVGFRFASHGRTHARLDRADEATLDAELRESRDAIEQRLGAACRLFAYPYGRSTARVRRVSARHYAAAFGTRLAGASVNDDLFDLSRIDACYLRTPRALERFVSGRWRGWLRMRRAVREARQLATH